MPQTNSNTPMRITFHYPDTPSSAAVLARLLDQAPIVMSVTVVVPVIKPPMICAWCPDWNPLDPKNRFATHVLCAPCRERLEQETA